ncbi:YqaE/Pmp3 family membrane protein [Shewanella intestini]|uniref:YqaE/Pmp3 family membrane protein n=1 Tax=Shewanella intestini TaxID=2017544 RepID=A0ABS5I7P7_9GAMM|nr:MULTISPECIES: YqaE/Pmp3 family membrane protein [Shewanella]MBR9729335.1 YqaE/Pmp3 family membrane protein [Shewanella intestini]MRG37414.1 YqaE/Pmp3 family membrane protein [Shewanella sp. XMDDZSB0408]
MDIKKLLLIIIAILLPPVSVLLSKGVGKDLLINVLLTILMFVPGIIHAIWVLFQD